MRGRNRVRCITAWAIGVLALAANASAQDAPTPPPPSAPVQGPPATPTTPPTAPPGAASEPRQERTGRTSDAAYLWAVAAGAGIVEPDTPSETYWTASVRRRIDSEGRGQSGRGGAEVSSRIRGYLEGEVGYWARPSPSKDQDTMVGLNIIGLMPTRGADLFVGIGFGMHFADSTPLSTGITESDSRLGGNLQFGVDIRVSHRLAVFGLGRFDILKGDINNQQTKVVGGLRLRL